MRTSFVLFLTSLIIIINASHSFNRETLIKDKTPNLRLLERYAGNTGHIPLLNEDQGFFVHVDFINHENEASETDDKDNDYGNMRPALYTDKTFFGKACQGFNDICEKYTSRCNQSTEVTHMVFPYFETFGQNAKSDVYLDYVYWFLKAKAVISSNCTGYYQGGYGLLGMGIDGDSLFNFLDTKPTFAVSISRNLSNGSLTFRMDSDKSQSSNAAATLSSDNNWHIYNIDSISVKGSSVDVQASMIFDLGFDSIGFPKETYAQVVSMIEKHPSIGGCSTGDDFRPVCNFTGDIKLLPTVEINIGKQKVEIPPEVYVVSTQSNDFYYDPITLKFKALSTNTSEGEFVTTSFNSYIILGYPAMSYYYVTFQDERKDKGGPSINLYYSEEYKKAAELTWIFVIIALCGVVGMSLIYCLFNKREKVMKKTYNTPLLGSRGATHLSGMRRLH